MTANPIIAYNNKLKELHAYSIKAHRSILEEFPSISANANSAGIRLSEGLCNALLNIVQMDRASDQILFIIECLEREALTSPQLIPQWDALLAHCIKLAADEINELRQPRNIRPLIKHKCFQSFQTLVIFANKTKRIKLLTALFDCLNTKQKTTLSREAWEQAMWMSAETAYRFEKQSLSVRKLLFKHKPNNAGIHNHNILAWRLALMRELHKHKSSKLLLGILKGVSDKQIKAKLSKIKEACAGMSTTDQFMRYISIHHAKLADKLARSQRIGTIIFIFIIFKLLAIWASAVS